MKRKTANPKPIGKCIYCGETAGDLSKEHAIPFALNGDLVLHKASCQECARITSRFETKSLRQLLAGARAKLGMRSRKTPPGLVKAALKIDAGYGWTTMQFERRDFAGITHLPEFKPPGFLSKEDNPTFQLVALSPLQLGDGLPSLTFDAMDGQHRYQWTVTHEPVAFAQMIAKIGYCCAVAHLGLENIAETYVTESILDPRRGLQQWIGSEPPLAYQGEMLHEVTTSIEEGIILARVRLFAAFGGPSYVVVVGKYRTV